MVSRPFSAFEKESLEIAGRLGRRPGSRSRYEADLRQWHASEMARSRSHVVILYATQYGYSVGSTLIERVLRFSWVSTHHDRKKVAFFQSLSRTTTPSACSLSLSPRRRKGGVHTVRWRWTADVSLKARRHQLLRRQRPAPGQVMLHQQQLAACFLLACQWPKIVQPRTGWRHARQQPDFLLLFGTCGDSSSGTTTGDGAAEWIKTIVLSSPFSSTSNRRTALKLGTTDLRGLRNTWVQKN